MLELNRKALSQQKAGDEKRASNHEKKFGV
jgi:hypothetical protein